jgi:hypothetical protein
MRCVTWAALVAWLLGRTRVTKDLAAALHRAVAMEREAFGLDTATGKDGRPIVIIRDFTGRGDPDAPCNRNKLHEDRPRSRRVRGPKSLP